MPIRSFWSASANINRLRAEEGLEAIDLLLIANANCDPAIAAKELREALIKRMGEPAKGTLSESSRDPPPEQHREGLDKLRQILG